MKDIESKIKEATKNQKRQKQPIWFWRILGNQEQKEKFKNKMNKLEREN